MTPFELVEPKTLKEAAGLLDPDDPTIRPLGGGTALMVGGAGNKLLAVAEGRADVALMHFGSLIESRLATRLVTRESSSFRGSFLDDSP